MYRWFGTFPNHGHTKANKRLSSHLLMHVVMLLVAFNYTKYYFNNEVYREGAVFNGGENKGLCLYRKIPVASELNITNHLSLLWYKPSVKAVSAMYSVKRFSGKI
jgi:hypothetical protein